MSAGVPAKWHCPLASGNVVRFLDEAGHPMAGNPGFSFQDLWDFYLESHFVYASKKAGIIPYLDQIFDTWNRLFCSGGDVARIVLRLKKGRVRNAMTMLRMYPRTWVVQHMASLADPKGMMLVLLDAIGWMMQNETLDFGRFYWQPQNRPAEKMFAGLNQSLQEKGIADKNMRSYHYHIIPLKLVDQRFPPAEQGFTYRPVEPSEFGDISGLLREDWGPIDFQAQALEAGHLDLAGLNDLYHPHGLHRSRLLLVAEKGGKPAGVAGLEFSNLGMNFSYCFNRFELYYLAPHVSTERRNGILSGLVRAGADYYAQRGRDFMVLFCDVEGFSLETMGLAPDRHYKCLSLSRQSGNSATMEHFMSFYRDRMAEMPAISKWRAGANFG